MKILLCGFMGAGKTTLLNRLSCKDNSLQFQFIDLDKFIEEDNFGKYSSLATLINTEGLDHFRILEEKAIRKIFNQYKSFILSLGGGSLDNKNVINLVRSSNCKLVWLDTSWEKCFKRIKNDKNRPLVAEGELAVRQLYVKRLISYKKYSDLRLQESEQEKIESLEDLIKNLEQLD